MRPRLSAIFAIALGTVIASTARAQAPLVSYEAVYDTASHKAIGVVTTPGPTLTDVLGTKQSFQLWYFAGADAFGKPVAGANLKFKYHFAKELDLVAGPAVILNQGSGWKATVFFGFTYRTGS